MSDMAARLRAALPDVTMSFQGDPDYDKARATWNVRTQARPLGLVQPSNTAQVQAVVRAARAAGVTQLAIRSGGHSIEGNGLGGPDSHALVIDLVKMRAISVDPQAKVVTAEPAVLTGILHSKAFEHQLSVPTGDCLNVGLGGQVTAGGYGRCLRTFGNLTDQALEFEVVTMDGEVRTANTVEHPDLFWALRGSGTGSFGIITRMRLRANDAPKAPANFTFRWHFDEVDVARTLIEVQRYCLDSPVTFSPILVAWRGMIELSGGLFTDTPEQRDALIADMRAKLPTPTETPETEPMTFLQVLERQSEEQTSAHWLVDASTVTREANTHPRYQKIRAGFLPNPLSESLIHEFADLLKRQQPGNRVQFCLLNPDVEPPVADCAIKNRGCTWLSGFGTDIDLGDMTVEELRAEGDRRYREWEDHAYELFHPYSVGPYIGDDDLMEGDRGRDLFEAYYGEHLPRLKQIKRKYDPDNLLHHKMSIPLE
ncbi:FAD/FMN-containing dehydrogenase [Nocardia pseudobrasiliensis]|uniref:FAD/FMN-containing dehydrogenase n=1 Tax=Nocardia pseudobrasiliensis TaxID=45979 RepID=A0A370ICF3_9NOCA|nr:FAD/FMN-containing dehydrogenase [Nocardia pseudobrasiliensis]